MNRVDIIQRAANTLRAKTYLEIGIKRGATFLKVSVPRKYGVDPDPRLSRRAVARACLRDPQNLFNSIHRQTSSEFFTNVPSKLRKRGVDLAFVDGLHTYQQSYEDVEHCLRLLNPAGVILLHDCNPGSLELAQPAPAPPIGISGWSGDVWKTLVRLRSTRTDLSTFVLDCDTGVGVVSRNGSSEHLEPSCRSVEDMEYKDLSADRAHLLGLRPPSYLDHFLKGIAA